MSLIYLRELIRLFASKTFFTLDIRIGEGYGLKAATEWLWSL